MKRIFIFILGLISSLPLFADSFSASQHSDLHLPDASLSYQSDSQPSAEDFANMSPAQFRRYKFDQAWAEFPKFEARVAYAGFPMLDGLMLMGDADKSPELALPSLNQLYRPQNGTSYMTGNIYAEFAWNVNKWFSLVASMYFNGFWGSTVDPSTLETVDRQHGLSFSLLPTARFYWFNAPKCRLYSSIGMGIYTHTYAGYTEPFPTFQVSPIGVTAGKKLFFFAEYSFGFSTLGGQIGVGYRF